MDVGVEALIYLGGVAAVILVAWAAWTMNRRKPGA